MTVKPVNNGREGPWGHDEILAAGLAWAERFEGPPTRADWNPAQLHQRIVKAKAHVAELEEREQAARTREFPGVEPTIRVFGSWPAFIAALGFTPRPAHKPTVVARAVHREQARELAALGPLHLRLLTIIDRGGRTEDKELIYQLARPRDLSVVPEPAQRDQALSDLEQAGLITHADRIVRVWELTARGRERIRTGAA